MIPQWLRSHRRKLLLTAVLALVIHELSGSIQTCLNVVAKAVEVEDRG
jgi:hypothetical protein